MTSETKTHSFVIRIWLEETDETQNEAIWRGHITHVLSEEKRYFKQFDEVLDFIRLHLEQIGLPPRR